MFFVVDLSDILTKDQALKPSVPAFTSSPIDTPKVINRCS